MDVVGKEDDPFRVIETPIGEILVIVPIPEGESDEVWDEISKEIRWATFLYYIN